MMSALLNQNGHNAISDINQWSTIMPWIQQLVTRKNYKKKI